MLNIGLEFYIEMIHSSKISYKLLTSAYAHQNVADSSTLIYSFLMRFDLSLQLSPEHL